MIGHVVRESADADQNRPLARLDRPDDRGLNAARRQRPPGRVQQPGIDGHQQPARRLRIVEQRRQVFGRRVPRRERAPPTVRRPR